MFKNYQKIALRNLRKYKGYTFINVVGLAMGLAVCLSILLFVRHELSYDRFHDKEARIYRAVMELPEISLAVTPSAVGPIFQQQFPEVEDWVRLYEPTRYNPAVVRYEDKLFQETSFFYADSSFFDIFTFELQIGNPDQVLNRPNAIVLTRSMSKKYFGNQNPIGKTLEVTVNSDLKEFEVTGVMEDIPSNSHFRFDFLASLSTRSGWSQLVDDRIRAANFYTYLLLTDPQAIKSLRSKIPELLKKFIPDQSGPDIKLQPFTDIYLHSNQQAEIRPMGDIQYVYAFSAIALLVLIIACINYMNLATARSTRRASEVGMRKVLGARRGQLIGQFYGESLLITLLAVFFAVVIVELSLPFFNGLAGTQLSLLLFESPFIWGSLAAIVLFVSLAAGSYPALMLSSFSPSKVLKNSFRTSKKGVFYRKALVVFQFSISIFLVIGTLVIYDQIQFILDKNLGFEKEHVVVLPIGDQRLSNQFETLKSEMLRQTGVTGATGMSSAPGDVFGGYSVQKEGASEEDRIRLEAGSADSDVLSTLEINLLAGRGFPDNPSFSFDEYLYLINKEMADAMGWSPQEAVGKDFTLWESTPGRVVGVMENFNYASLKRNVDPFVFFMRPEMFDYLVVKIAPGNIKPTLTSMEQVWNQIAPFRPFEYNFLDDQFNSLYQSEMRMAGIFSSFAIFAILIACLGLVGLASYMVEQRTKEIGVRKVLGASITNILTLFSKEFVILVLTGFVISIPVAWYVMSQWLQNFAYRVDFGLAVVFFSGALSLIIALFTVSYQAVKAALLNPVESLRTE